MRLFLPAIALVAFTACGGGSRINGSVSCGLGTEEVNSVCIASARCGSGTHETDGACISDRSCGTGTTLMGTECVGLSSVTCGMGTTLLGNTCVGVAVSCGPGTVLSNGNECLPSGNPVTCGSGTVLQGSQCVATGAAITCGAGTMQQGNQCVPTGQTITCGSGTTLQGSQCIGTSTVTCGAGTMLQSNQCVAIGGAALYDVRVPVTVIPADGYSKIPVFSIGRLMSGAPAMDAVVLTVSPSYAGTISPATFNLGVLGTTSYFTPCVSTSPACVGQFTINMALASAPSTIVATTGTLTLQVPTGIGSPAACLTGGNVLFMIGDTGDWIHPGMLNVTQGTWSNTSAAAMNNITIRVTPMSSSQGLWWDAEFSTTKLGQPLAVNVYTMAERAPFASPGHPGIDIGGDGRGCNTISGAFQVHSLVWQGTTLKDFTATFEQHCERGTPALRGCVHYEQ